MVERSENLRFTFESGQSIGIECECSRQDLERHIAIELCVARAVDLAHAARTDESGDLVLADPSSGRKNHALMREASL